MKAIHLIDPNNIGDAVSCPVDYFPKFADAEKLDMRFVRVDASTFVGDAIVGGGGLLYTTMRQALQELLYQPVETKLVLWGVGMNTHGATKPDYPKFLGGYDLVGLRDYGSPFNYVPCPSCCHQVFDRSWPEPVHDVVLYEHRLERINIDEELPRMSNDQPADNMAEVIKFLASGKVVLTNTYHGAYWSMLINRPVVVYKPFSNRFYGFKPTVFFADEANWKQQVERALPVGTDYLHECRTLNGRFAQQVALLFG